MKSMKRNRIAYAIGLAVLGTPSAYAAKNLALEEVVVTAQKREQSA
ncbi:MAG: hypothetical protein ACJA1I_001568, partial [Zhongshania marina]